MQPQIGGDCFHNSRLYIHQGPKTGQQDSRIQQMPTESSTEDIIETMAETEESVPNYGAVDTSCLVESQGNIERRPRWYQGLFTKTRPEISNKEHIPDENPQGSLSTLNGVTIPTCLSMFRYILT